MDFDKIQELLVLKGAPFLVLFVVDVRVEVVKVSFFKLLWTAFWEPLHRNNVPVLSELFD